MIDDTQVPVKEGKCTSSTSLKVYRTAHFKLLMENIHVLEKAFVDSDELRLERDILLQLGRLGAINVFNTCLSRTLKISNVLDLSDVPTEHIGEHEMKSEVDDHIGKVIVHSGKMKERKSRRERTLKNASEISSLSMPSKTFEKHFGKATVSSVKRASRSRGRRLKVTRNEAEMSRGFRVSVNLPGHKCILLFML